MSFKNLFSKSLSAAPDRLHMAAHSHHLWPDASYDGQVECWNDAATLADRKWDKVLDEVLPQAQANVAAELGTGMADSIVFASNTHELLVRVLAAAAQKGVVRVLTSDGEFHSARRQLARWEETGAIQVERIAVEPFDDFAERFLEAARNGEHDVIFVSQILFGSGRIFGRAGPLAALGKPDGPWVMIDGYHAFMAVEMPFSEAAGQGAFYLGGGYKYAMAGEGVGFMHAPPGFAPRPPITGWFAEFAELAKSRGRVGYAENAMRFMGATFDPSGLYRFNAVQQMLRENGLTTDSISCHVAGLQARLLERLRKTPLGSAKLLNPLDGGPHARFLAFRSEEAKDWCKALKQRDCIVDVRGDVLRIGLGLYHEDKDIDRFAELAADLG